MTEVGKTAPTSPVEQLGEFVTAEQERMNSVYSFLVDALPIANDLEACNQRFNVAGRPDLVITTPATMMHVESPLEVLERCNNFTPKFQISTGFRTWEEDRSEYSLPPIERSERIPITTDDLVSIAEGAPKFRDATISHVRKPAFARMLILFPDFTRKLALDFSELGYSSLDQRYRAELFAAYQLMSRLVDQNDPHVMRDGEVDSWYLCR